MYRGSRRRRRGDWSKIRSRCGIVPGSYDGSVTDADVPGSGVDGRPDPAEAKNAAEFVELLAGLKRWSGLGLRLLERRALAAGYALPRSTLASALSKPNLPSEELVSALVAACGGSPDDVNAWLAARRRIAATGGAPDADTAIRTSSIIAGSIITGSITADRAGNNRGIVLVGLAALIVVLVMIFGPVLADPSPSGGQAKPSPSGERAGQSVPEHNPLPAAGSGAGLRMEIDKERAGLDFERGKTGHEGGDDKDIALDRQQNLKVRNNAQMAALDQPGRHDIQRCRDLPKDRWVTVLQHKTATDICVRTDQGNLAIATIEWKEGWCEVRFTLWRVASASA